MPGKVIRAHAGENKKAPAFLKEQVPAIEINAAGLPSAAASRTAPLGYGAARGLGAALRYSTAAGGFGALGNTTATPDRLTTGNGIASPAAGIALTQRFAAGSHGRTRHVGRNWRAGCTNSGSQRLPLVIGAVITPLLGSKIRAVCGIHLAQTGHRIREIGIPYRRRALAGCHNAGNQGKQAKYKLTGARHFSKKRAEDD